jgi:VanZ family protein
MNSARIGRKVVPWLPVVLWMAVIFYLSGQRDLPHHPEALIDLVIKKLGHMAEYTVLAVLAVWALRHGTPSTERRAFLWALVLAASYAVTDEIHQYFVPGRNPQPLDVGFDVLGACLGLLFISKVMLAAKGLPTH